MAKFSDRLDIAVPGDGQDEPADGQTTPISVTDPSVENWGDLLQTLILRDIDDNLAKVGPIGNRPAAGAGAPRWWLATDAGPNGEPLLSFNNEAAGQWVTIGSYLPGGVTVPDGLSVSGTTTVDDISDGLNTVYDATNAHVPQARVEQGPGSLLDADTVDGYQGADLGALAESETVTGRWTFGDDFYSGAPTVRWRTAGGGGDRNVIYDAFDKQALLQCVERTDATTPGYVDVPFVELQSDGTNVLTRQANIPMTGIADTEVATGLQKHIPAGQTLLINEVGVQTDGQTTPAGLTVEVQDLTNAVSILSQNTAYASGTPLASADGGIDVQFRVSNATGGTVNASGYVWYSIRD